MWERVCMIVLIVSYRELAAHNRLVLLHLLKLSLGNGNVLESLYIWRACGDALAMRVAHTVQQNVSPCRARTAGNAHGTHNPFKYSDDSHKHNKNNNKRSIMHVYTRIRC